MCWSCFVWGKRGGEGWGERKMERRSGEEGGITLRWMSPPRPCRELGAGGGGCGVSPGGMVSSAEGGVLDCYHR